MPMVLITGVFDGLHQEHLNFLKKARKYVNDLKNNQADCELWVGIESDQRVKQLKGEARPINAELIRKKALEETHLIDHVFILPVNFGNESERETLIDKLRPICLLVSSHTPFLEQKKQLLTKYGGEVVVIHQHNPDISTTKLLGD